MWQEEDVRRRFAERRKPAGMRKEAPRAGGASPGFESVAVGREPVRPRMARRPGAGSAGARAETGARAVRPGIIDGIRTALADMRQRIFLAGRAQEGSAHG